MDIQVDLKNINVSAMADYVINQLQEQAREAGKWAADELTMEATKAIYEFYGGYSPEIYNRTGGLLKSYKRYYSNKHGNIIYGGVELVESPSNYYSVFGKNKGVESAFVDSLAWFAGRHGFTEGLPESFHITNYPPVMKPTPHEMLMKKLHEVENGLEKFFK